MLWPTLPTSIPGHSEKSCGRRPSPCVKYTPGEFVSLLTQRSNETDVREQELSRNSQSVARNRAYTLEACSTETFVGGSTEKVMMPTVKVTPSLKRTRTYFSGFELQMMDVI
ncbi:hypothetical protein EVAR_71082_1 [Eumeta japonica]|uniref:Uncharacterized protein n=1 Tax=Eumeta variegata TaxID=151549 RepID=A0A4C2A707_EUMVA|nr:hypothetical protein EVAR_71082_1 [Eumeta japonica]